MTELLISVITPSYNCAEFIAEAIESVLSQGYENFEHIVCDGGSTDQTLAVLSNYPHLKVVSEPDKGLYDANNKGINLAQGDIITILNADDIIQPGVFAAAISMFESDSEIEMVSGTAKFFEYVADGTVLEDQPETPPILKSANADEMARIFCHLLKAAPYINSRFFKKCLVERVGSFSLDYPISGDREFMLRVVLCGANDHPLDMTSYAYRRHAGSLTMDNASSNRGRIAVEHMEMALQFMPQVNSLSMMKCLRHWHTREAYKLIRILLKEMKIKDGFSTYLKALSVDGWWPLRAIFLGPWKIYKKVTKKL